MSETGDIQIICVFGATATGKSDLAVAIAEEVGGEVISVDSMQIYRGFDIGTGKISEADRRGIPHYLLDICDPSDRYSAGHFQRDADRCIRDIAGRGLVPVLAGGTGLYFRALLLGLAPVGEPDSGLRARLRKRAESRGIESVYRLLRRLDPKSAMRLPEGDTQRILRALEYRVATGRRLSEAIEHKPFGRERYNAVKIGLDVDRKVLRDRIDKRVDRMFQQGWVDEVRTIISTGCDVNSQALRAIGYREIVQYLQKEVSLGDAIKQIKKATHHYAKRQETWFRRESGVRWLNALSKEQIRQEAIQYLKGY